MYEPYHGPKGSERMSRLIYVTEPYVFSSFLLDLPLPFYRSSLRFVWWRNLGLSKRVVRQLLSYTLDLPWLYPFRFSFMEGSFFHLPISVLHLQSEWHLHVQGPPLLLRVIADTVGQTSCENSSLQVTLNLLVQTLTNKGLRVCPESHVSFFLHYSLSPSLNLSLCLSLIYRPVSLL